MIPTALAVLRTLRAEPRPARTRRRGIQVAALLLMATSGCLPAAGQRGYGVSPRLAQERARRIALLVSRVATERFHATTEITGEFDYARV
jgi:hypothetical protein